MSTSTTRKIIERKRQKRAFDKPFEKKESSTIKVLDSHGNVIKTIKNGKYEKEV